MIKLYGSQSDEVISLTSLTSLTHESFVVPVLPCALPCALSGGRAMYFSTKGRKSCMPPCRRYIPVSSVAVPSRLSHPYPVYPLYIRMPVPSCVCLPQAKEKSAKESIALNQMLSCAPMLSKEGSVRPFVPPSVRPDVPPSHPPTRPPRPRSPCRRQSRSPERSTCRHTGWGHCSMLTGGCSTLTDYTL